jgi:hypothetical protein
VTIWRAVLVALKSGTWVTALPGLLSLAVTIGVLTGTQETAIQAAATGLATLITLVMAGVHTVTKAKAIRRSIGPAAAQAMREE